MVSEEINFEPIGRYIGRSTDKAISMQKVDYRCYRCMAVVTILLSNLERPPEYITCGECGGASNRIGIGSIARPHSVDPTQKSETFLTACPAEIDVNILASIDTFLMCLKEELCKIEGCRQKDERVG